jgi:hypothetical protein
MLSLRLSTTFCVCLGVFRKTGSSGLLAADEVSRQRAAESKGSASIRQEVSQIFPERQAQGRSNPLGLWDITGGTESLFRENQKFAGLSDQVSKSYSRRKTMLWNFALVFRLV